MSLKKLSKDLLQGIEFAVFKYEFILYSQLSLLDSAKDYGGLF